MKSVCLILSEGFEEIEAISVIDILRRGGVNVDIFSTNDLQVTGAHGITIFADEIFDYYSCLDFDCIAFAGGMKNAINLSENNDVLKLIEYYYDNDKLVAGICATPAIVFSKTKILECKDFTCYPDENLISKVNGKYIDEPVVFDEVLTSQSPATAIQFGLAILDILGYDSTIILNDLEG